MRSEAEHLAVRVARCERMLIGFMERYNATHTFPLYTGDYHSDMDLSEMKADFERWEETGQV